MLPRTTLIRQSEMMVPTASTGPLLADYPPQPQDVEAHALFRNADGIDGRTLNTISKIKRERNSVVDKVNTLVDELQLLIVNWLVAIGDLYVTIYPDGEGTLTKTNQYGKTSQASVIGAHGIVAHTVWEPDDGAFKTTLLSSRGPLFMTFGALPNTRRLRGLLKDILISEMPVYLPSHRSMFAPGFSTSATTLPLAVCSKITDICFSIKLTTTGSRWPRAEWQRSVKQQLVPFLERIETELSSLSKLRIDLIILIREAGQFGGLHARAYLFEIFDPVIKTLRDLALTRACSFTLSYDLNHLPPRIMKISEELQVDGDTTTEDLFTKADQTLEDQDNSPTQDVMFDELVVGQRTEWPEGEYGRAELYGRTYDAVKHARRELQKKAWTAEKVAMEAGRAERSAADKASDWEERRA